MTKSDMSAEAPSESSQPAVLKGMHHCPVLTGRSLAEPSTGDSRVSSECTTRLARGLLNQFGRERQVLGTVLARWLNLRPFMPLIEACDEQERM